MKRLAWATCLLMLAGSAAAQDAGPNEDVISLSVGRTQVVPFSQPFGEVNFMPKEVADAVPLSNQRISVVGIKPGVTQMYVFSTNGTLIYNAAVAVASEGGHLVKIYSPAAKDASGLDNAFVGVYCDEYGCGRPDKDITKPAVTVERIVRDRR